MLLFPNPIIKQFLERFFESAQNNQNLPAASLLFEGEKNLGKFTIAKEFTKALLCLKKKKEWGGCNNCYSCSLIEKNLHPDLKIIDSSLNSISIDEIKGKEEENKEGLIQFLSFYPQVSSFRIAIINEADKLTKDAQNSFLKTLEEPPLNSLIILITNKPSSLLETILSRVISVRFNRVSKEKLFNYLEKEYKIDKEKAEKIAFESGGKIGLAVKLLNKEFTETRENLWLDFKKLLKTDYLFRISYVEKKIKEIYKDLEEDKEEGLKNKIKDILTIWLEKLEKEIKENTQEINLPIENKIKLVQNLLKTYYLISESSVNTHLLLDNLFLNI